MKIKGNKKPKDRNNRKIKRQISIITIFLWIFLVVTMITVVTQDIKNTNALESDNVEIYGEISKSSKATNDTSNNKPQAPTVDKIISSIGPNIVINFYCANATKNHNAVNNGLESGDKITVSEVIENDGSDGVSSVTYPWICDVGLDSEYWLNVYNNFASSNGWGNHLTAYNGDKLRLYYNISNGGWSYRNSDLTFEYDIVDSPTIGTIYTTNNISLVSIECNNNSSHNKVYKNFISNDSFIVENVMLNDGSYGESSSTYPCICDIKLNSDYWLEKYNQDLGVEHLVKQDSQTLRLFYNKNYNEWGYYASSIPLKIEVKEEEYIEKVSISTKPNERYPYIGEEFQYTIKIENANEANICVNIIDVLPDGLEYVSSSNSGTYDKSCNIVTWSNVNIPGYRLYRTATNC